MNKRIYFAVVVVLSTIIWLSTDCVGQQSAAIADLDIDTTKHKELKLQGVAGSAFVVPEGKVWEVKMLTISSGSYPVKVNSLKFTDKLMPGEKLKSPAWLAEGELLSEIDFTDLTFSFKVKEYDLK